MPKILMLMDLISAETEDASNKNDASQASSFLMGVS
jgi:hypothetical protein